MDTSKYYSRYLGVAPPEGFNVDSFNFNFNEDIDELPMTTIENTTIPDSIYQPIDSTLDLSLRFPELKPIKIKENDSIKEPSSVSIKGNPNFDKAYEQAVKINPEVANYKNFLYTTAKLESSFKPNVTSVTGNHFGYFLMGVPEIKATTGLTPSAFMKDPVKQILGAVKLYKAKLLELKNNGAYDLGINNYSEHALVAGSWLGGSNNTLKFLKGLGDASDSKAYSKSGKKGGTSISRRMEIFKTMKG